MLIGHIAHAHIHHPHQHTPLNIIDCHLEPSLYQGASANSPAVRTVLRQRRMCGFATVYSSDQDIRVFTEQY